MQFGDYKVEVTGELKKIIFETKDKDKGLMIHRAAFILLTHKNGPMVRFKITKKRNHFDSRDKKGKTTTEREVRSELCRMLGNDGGVEVYAKAMMFV